MAISLVTSLTASPGGNGGTTAALDTTGADLLVVSLSWYAGVSTSLGLSDAKGNVWTPLTKSTFSGPIASQLFYVLTPTVGTGHTFTITGGTSSPAVFVYAFSGVGSCQTESYAGSASSPLASGSVTPAANGALLVTGHCAGVTTTDTITPSGFTIANIPTVGGVVMPASAAYAIQPTAGAINPTWSWPQASTINAVSTAVFLPAVALAAPLVASVSASPGTHGGTTAAIDTTGATVLVLNANWYPAVTTDVTVSDAKGNTWTPLTRRTSGSGVQRLFYVLSPTVGAGHTFTVSGTSTAATVVVYAFSGAWSYQTESGSSGGGTPPRASGSVTPAAHGALLVTALMAVSSAAPATDVLTTAGFSLVTTEPYAATSAHNSAAWQVQTTAAAIDPTWSWFPTATHGAVAVGTAVFVPGAPAAVATAQPYVWGPI